MNAIRRLNWDEIWIVIAVLAVALFGVAIISYASSGETSQPVPMPISTRAEALDLGGHECWLVSEGTFKQVVCP
jgi:hypothetical protein